MIVLGLTGSIGMGKSTTSEMFRQAGVPVFDADAAVHALYAGRAVPLIGEAFPGTVTDGRIDRAKLGAIVLKDASALARLEGLIHPLVGEEEKAFMERITREGHRICVMDVPLLLEGKRQRRLNAVIVVSASAEIQRQRVLARDGMTEDKLQSILAKQMPDAEKRKRAHFIIDTGLGMESARRQVDGILRCVRGMRGIG